ncbi:MAG TPA: styrene monooxygenase/indole monooxygenase family protein [Trebonia sp.]
MRKILIVGAGQAGLQLALSLQAEGYDVTVMSARTSDEIRNGWPTSTQVMMYRALDRERDVKLNLWDGVATPIGGIGFNLSPAPGVSAFSFSGAWARPGNSVDQRVKMPTWIELFEQRGGRVIYHSVMTSDLAGLAPMYDLTIIAAGKGEIVDMFDRDAENSSYSRPARNLAVIYANGVAVPEGVTEPRMRVNLSPGIGEYLHMPSYTLSGPADVLLVEAIPGGPFDIFTDRPAPAEHLRRLKAMLLEYLPWEGELFRDAEPTDARASLVGAFPGTVRRPYAEVAPGSYVFGIGDVVVVNDPISGQGANNAALASGMYLNAILDRGGAPFTPQWMQQTFDTFWAHAQNSCTLTRMMLEPPPPHVQQVLGAGAQFQEIADRFANIFIEPATIHDFLLDPDKAAAYVESVAAAHR